jgi:hypothetical protein
VLINKADLSPGYVAEVTRRTNRAGASLVGCLPFEPAVPQLLARAETPLSLDRWAGALRSAWARVLELLPEAAARTAQGGA